MKRKNKRKNPAIYAALEKFRNKSAAWQSQATADRLLRELKGLLPEAEWWQLSIAHSHYLTGEGAGELYDVCKELKYKYLS